MLLLAVTASLLGADLATLAAGAVVAAAAPDAHAELVALSPPRATACRAHQVVATTKVHASGRVALRIAGVDSNGRACTTWANAQVRVERSVAVTTGPVARGALLADSIELRTVEVKRRAAWRIPGAAASAARDLPPGTVVLASDVAAGPSLGTPVRVVMATGALAVTTHGQVSACPRGDGDDAVCATLGNGRHVRGDLDGPIERGGVLRVVMPW
ncbi:MAG: hypothetical protein IT383_22240 [Deltaproteobacteria bacterium]|nr:hypothetical protein [Deltaproteobacteria bacterium]